MTIRIIVFIYNSRRLNKHLMTTINLRRQLNIYAMISRPTTEKKVLYIYTIIRNDKHHYFPPDGYNIYLLIALLSLLVKSEINKYTIDK